MAMFPVFLLGVGAGALVTFLIYSYINSRNVPSETKLRLQEATIISLQSDIEALEEENKRLNKKLSEQKKTKKKVE